MPNRQTRRALQGKGRNKGGTTFSRLPPPPPPPDPPPPERRPQLEARPQEPLAEIRWAVERQGEADRAVRAAVRRARAAGESWTSIGAALGVTRQSAWERYK
jgi:hypothetical protein